MAMALGIISAPSTLKRQLRPVVAQSNLIFLRQLFVKMALAQIEMLLPLESRKLVELS